MKEIFDSSAEAIADAVDMANPNETRTRGDTVEKNRQQYPEEEF